MARCIGQTFQTSTAQYIGMSAPLMFIGYIVACPFLASALPSTLNNSLVAFGYCLRQSFPCISAF